MDWLLVIPARYKSSRLPGKPLIELHGVPMLKRTYLRCIEEIDPSKVVVATDDERIEAYCRQENIAVIMTPGDCLTGTDRVACVAKLRSADYYINVQGDEPLINPQDISRVIEAAYEHPGDIVNGVAKISDEELYRSPTMPKAVMRPDGRLLYMSRAPIPSNKSQEFVRAWRQICIYAFPRDALFAFASVQRKTPLEEMEDIELLRFLELGYEVRMVILSDESLPVDVPEDIVRVEKEIARRSLVDV